MYWNASVINNLFIDLTHGQTGQAKTTPVETLQFTVTLFDNGNGIVTIQLGPQNQFFKARLVKGVTLVNVK